MTIIVPIDEAAKMRQWMADCRKPWLGGSPLLRMVEFIEHFAMRLLPGMSQDVVAGEIMEIRLIDDSLEALGFDIIRLNGRVFVPEVIEVVDEGYTDEVRERVVEALLALPEMKAGDTERDSAILCADTVAAALGFSV